MHSSDRLSGLYRKSTTANFSISTKGNTDMTYDRATNIIWVPDMHELGEVAAAAETVLSQRGADFADRWQASYLLTTFARPLAWQYVSTR